MTRLHSLLFVPGNQAKMLAKAESVAADVFVPDLEDSVPDAEKSNARATTLSFLPQLAAKSRLVVPRVNSLATPWFEDDLASVVGAALAAPGVFGLSIGKIDSPSDIDEIGVLLTRLERRAGLGLGSVKLIPWIVCTIVRIPARRAAHRPRIPALLLCVWTTSGRIFVKIRTNARAARMS